MKTGSMQITQVGAPTPRAVAVPVPDPRSVAAVMFAVFGGYEVSARVVAAARRAPLGRVLAELEHARVLGLVDQSHPGYYWCTPLAEQLPAPKAALVGAARSRAGVFLLACSRHVAEVMPGSLLPPVRIAALPAPDPTIVDAHAGYDWAQIHRPAVMKLAADTARAGRDERKFGMLAVDLALAGIAGAMAAGNTVAWEALANIAFDASLTVDDNIGQGYGLEHLGKSRKAQGRFEKARATQCAALRHREAIHDARGIVCSTNAVGLAHWAIGDLTGAEAIFEQAVKLADESADRDFAALARQNLAGVLTAGQGATGETFATALQLLDRAAARHTEAGLLQALANCHSLRAAALRRRASADGDFTAAVLAGLAAVQAVDRSAEIGLAGHDYAELARALSAAGNDQQARAWAETAIALFHCAGSTDREQMLREEFAHLGLESDVMESGVDR